MVGLVGRFFHLPLALSLSLSLSHTTVCFVLFLKLKSLNALIVVVVVLELISRMNFAAKFCSVVRFYFFWVCVFA